MCVSVCVCECVCVCVYLELLSSDPGGYGLQDGVKVFHDHH